MITPTAIPPADLLAQLGDLINATQTVSADAEKWRLLIRLLHDERDYGPLITPAQIVNLVPSAKYVANIAALSQEVPPPAAPKSTGRGKRRIITDADREIIRRAHADGLSPREIIAKYGYSASTVARVLE